MSLNQKLKMAIIQNTKDEVDSKVTDETESASTDTGAEENANAYQTRYAKTNSITAPEFQFDTPSGWEIISTM